MTRWEYLTRKAAKTTVSTFKVDDYVEYHYQEGVTCKICALFDSDQGDVSLGGEVMIDSVQHFIMLEKYALTRKPMVGDMVTRRNVTYEVIHIDEDGHASYRLRLHEVDTTNARKHIEII